jgi:hypothetical protein
LCRSQQYNTKVLWKSSVIFVALLGGLTAQTPFPKFEDFPVKEIFKGTPAKPIFRTPAQRMFRTMIRQGAAAGPNFAGRYSVAQWGCGSGCVSMALVDAKTGVVFDVPFEALAFWPGYEYQDVSEDPTPDKLGARFRLNSRLFVIRGCKDELDCWIFLLRVDRYAIQAPAQAAGQKTILSAQSHF